MSRILCFTALSILLVGCEVKQQAVDHRHAPGQPEPPQQPALVQPDTLIPNYYVWDGHEYIGWVGDKQYIFQERSDKYMYWRLGGWRGNEWVACDQTVLERFQTWAKNHPQWREDSINYGVHITYRK